MDILKCLSAQKYPNIAIGFFSISKGNKDVSQGSNGSKSDLGETSENFISCSTC